jgi:hypothetical protein
MNPGIVFVGDYNDGVGQEHNQVPPLKVSIPLPIQVVVISSDPDGV